MNRPTRYCRKCGKPFTASKNDYTVNCPEHRGRATTSASTEGYRPPPVDRFALGRAHGLSGKPRLATGMLDYHRGYDQGQEERVSGGALDDGKEST